MIADNKIATASIFAGGGEMGELTRAKDWASTALGSPETWPAALRTTLNIVLNSRFPMFIFWGPELNCFYNDAYRPSLGNDGKHPSILGMRGEDAWPEIWPVIKPLIDQVMCGAGATWNENSLIPIYRNGKMEDVYWTFSYSPIADENGAIGGVLVTCVETTHQVQVVKRLIESETNYRHLVFEAPISTAVFRTKDFVIELANSPSLKLWGKTDAVIGKKLLDAMPEMAGQPYIGLLSNVFESGETYHGRESLAYLEKDGELRPVYVNFVFKALRNADGVINGVLAMGYDVTEQVRSREEIAVAEETARLSIDNAKLGTYERNYITGEVHTSDRLREMMGITDPETSLEQILSVYHPEDVTVRNEAWERALITGELKYELRVLHAGGVVKWVQVHGKLFFNELGKPLRVIGTAKDVTEEHENRGMLEALEKKFRTTVSQAPVGICILKGEDFVVDTANPAYLEVVDRGEEGFVGRPLFASLPEVKELVEPLLRKVYETGQDFYGNEFPVIINKSGSAETCYFNFVYQAMRDEQNQINGIIVVATDVTSQVEAQFERLEAEKEFRNMVMQSPVAMTIIRGEDFIIEIANKTLLDNIWRRKESEVMGKPILKAFPELNEQKFPALLREVWNSGKSYKETEAMALVEGDDGMQKFYLDFEYAPLFNKNNAVDGIMITVNDVTERVESRHKVEVAEARLRMAIEGTGIATFDADLHSNDLVYSSRFSEIFGYEPGAQLNRDIIRTQFDPDDIQKQLNTAAEKAKKTGRYFMESKIKRPNGEVAWIRAQGKVQFKDGIASRLVGTIMDITEQKFAETRSARLVAIVETSDDAIISKDLNGIITSWNEGASRIFGYLPEEVIGKPIGVLIPEDRKNESTDILAKIRSGKRIEHFETKRLAKSGNLLDISLTVSPILDKNGQVEGVSKIARDITAQKLAERTISENEAKLQIIVEASEVGTWDMNFVTDEVNFSEKYLSLLGFPAGSKPTHQELSGRIVEEDIPVRDAAFEKALKTGYLLYVARIQWPDLSQHWIEVRGKVFYDENKRPSRLMGILRDITDERESRQALEKNEQKFRLLADSMPQLIWTTDAEGKVNYYNRAIYDHTGIPVDKLMEDRWVDMIHPDDREPNYQRWKRSVESGEEYLFENRFYRASHGDYRWHLSRAIPQRNEQGEIVMWVGTSTEIHEQKLFARELEQKVDERTHDLQQANYHLEQMNQELASFAYVSSHDLQEPLRKIQTFATRISEMEKLSDEASEYFQRMQNAARRMQLLIDDLLTYSRTNTAERIFEEIDLNALVADVVVDMDQMLQEKNGIVEIKNLPKLNVIPFQFSQLFVNLLSNSVKFSRPDVDPIIVITASLVNGEDIDHVAVNKSKNYQRISVSDNGIGFDPVYKNRIFELFQRLHGRNDYKGTGIGLAICKKIVENHFGFIMAEGEVDHGATFHIFVPV